MKSERDIAPDVLRGFALFGILVVNIPFMALSSENGARGEYVQGALNGSVALLMLALSGEGGALWILSSGGGSPGITLGFGMRNPPPAHRHVVFV